MASTYALPASAMTHSRGHGHIHSHSHSPSRPYTSRTLKPERSNGSLHSHSQSDVHLDQSHSHSHSHSHSSHSHAHSHNHSHSREREPSSSPYLPNPPDGTGLPPIERFEKQLYERSPALSALGSYETPLNDVNVVSHDHSHPLHPHTPQVEPRSRFTNLILPLMLRWPLLHTIMAEKDSRRIFYFMSLNFAFMVVQACYGFVTDSLGLLSDSIHMFFDCLALGVGLFAAIASKWPPSERFPYGFGKIESLSGFGNGVFLMLISIEIMIEATERLAEGRETKRLGELFVVSALGLAVNLVGMACFGHHGHAGHDHGAHSHDHSHSHTDEKAHAHDCHDHHDHDHKHDHDHEHDHGHSHHDSLMSQSPSKKAASKASHAGHSHSHSHDNENMHGIFLHVLADTMGSAAVMVSTALIYFVGWNGWDPLASCVIAILIFLSSIPLIKSCAKKLLLTVPDEIEYTLRDALGGLSDLRGVASYSVPRFWMGDKNTGSESEQVLGVIHIVTTRGSDIDDVRERARDLLLVHGIDAVLQIEASGDMSCWCGSSASRTPSTSASGF